MEMGDFIFYRFEDRMYLIGVKGKPETIRLPDSFDGESYHICVYAFYNCNSLIDVVIPDSIKSIGEGAFMNCVKLTNATIPDSVTEVGSDAFKGCLKLNIYVSNPENINMWDAGWNPDNRPIFDAKTGRQLKKTLFGGWK
jgi:hypothetical protein